MSVPSENLKPHEKPREEGLTAGTVFTQVYEELKNQNPHREVKLETSAFAEVGDDSDHKMITGEMVYDSAMIITVDGKNWLIAKATQTFGYPADRYSSDLTAIPYDPADKSEEEISKDALVLISKSIYFSNSLVIALYDGRIGANPKGRFDIKVLDYLKQPTTEFIAQDMEVDRSVVFPDLSPFITSPIRYKPELVHALTAAIFQTLYWSKTSNPRG